MYEKHLHDPMESNHSALLNGNFAENSDQATLHQFSHAKAKSLVSEIGEAPVEKARAPSLKIFRVLKY